MQEYLRTLGIRWVPFENRMENHHCAIRFLRQRNIWYHLRLRFRYNLVWRYFTISDPSNERCNLCGAILNSDCGYVTNLTQHLLVVHLEAMQELREEFEWTWLKDYFIFRRSITAKCRNCRYECSLFNGGYHLRDHLFIRHNLTRYYRGPLRHSPHLANVYPRSRSPRNNMNAQP